MQDLFRCPRCAGRLFYEDSALAQEWACLNCGYHRAATAAERLAVERARAHRRPAARSATGDTAGPGGRPAVFVPPSTRREEVAAA